MNTGNGQENMETSTPIANHFPEKLEEIENEKEAVQNASRVEVDRNVLSAIFKVLRKYKWTDTESMLKKEAHIPADLLSDNSETDVNKILLTYKNDGNPALYKDAYYDLVRFVENSLDAYKYELGILLYPVFIHMYLELIFNSYGNEAAVFMNTYSPIQEPYYQEDIKKFSCITNKEQVMNDKFVSGFRSTTFTIRISRETVNLLKRFLKEKDYNILSHIIKNHIEFDTYEGVPRNKSQIEITAGAFAGEAKRKDNQEKVYYGLLKEPDLQSYSLPPSPEDEEEEEGESNIDDVKLKKKKAKKDLLLKKVKQDPNAPPIDRMPLPELGFAYRLEKAKAIKESAKRVILGPDCLPSVCCYTVLNSKDITCTEMSEDGSILAVGFVDCTIRLWSLNPQKLKSMKPAEYLQDINLESEDVFSKIMDERSGENCKTLVGHSRAVYKVSFSPDRILLVSCSADGSVRLWCLTLWTCLAVYKGHIYATWDIEFSPHGYYFATGSHDKTARLWATDNHQPLKIFVGHYSDVDVVRFHPNSNYLATGSSDRTVRLWDCATGMQVRLMTGHKSSIIALTFSVNGRFLTSAEVNGAIHVWDLANGHLVAALEAHNGLIFALAFSRDGNILASGSDDFTVKLWDFTKITADVPSADDVNNANSNPENVKKNTNEYLLRTLRTKQSSILHLFFTRRNVLYTVTRYDAEAN